MTVPSPETQATLPTPPALAAARRGNPESPTDCQARAIDAAMAWFRHGTSQEFHLQGYFGTGKSTTVDAIVRRVHAELGGADVRTVTQTGKAAEVLRRKGVANACTIHSLFYDVHTDESTGELVAVLDRTSPARRADFVVVDEASMVNRPVADDIRSFGVPLLVVSDPEQLPPVSGEPGFRVRRPDAFLDEIVRQARDNPIVRISELVRTGGRVPTGEWGDGVRVMRWGPTCGPYILDPEAQVICGIHRRRWQLTERIRRELGHTSPLPETGERVICRRNDHRAGLFNGQTGVVLDPPKALEDGSGLLSMRVDAEGPREPIQTAFDPYLFNEHARRERLEPEADTSTGFHHWDFGWVLTGHVSQGSEWPRVTVVDDSRVFGRHARNWLYTTVTRASEELTLVIP